MRRVPLTVVLLASALLVGCATAAEPKKFYPSKLMQVSHQAGGFEGSNIVGAPDHKFWYPQWTGFGKETISMEYDTPVFLAAVDVHQGRNPGVLQSIDVQWADSDSIWVQVWARDGDSQDGLDAGLLTLNMDAPTCLPGGAAFRLRLTLNTKLNSGWNGFDTVGLVGFETAAEYEQWLSDSGKTVPGSCSELWAVSVTGKSSENEGDQYKADKIIGPNDDQAFFTLYSDYGSQWISVAFTEGFPDNIALFLKSVTIYQKMNPGAIQAVAIRNNQIDWVTVWRRSDENRDSLKEDGPVTLTLDCVPAVSFNELKISLDTASIKGFNGIDAVKVDVSYTNPHQDAEDALKCTPFQWASEIIRVRSQTEGWPAWRMLGRPDNQVYYPIDWIEWRDWWGTDYVILDMPYNSHISALIVNQYGGPGAVNNVYVQSEEDYGDMHKWYRLYHTQKGDTLHTERSFSIPFECIPNFKVKRIRFTIRTQMVPAYNGYDAMGVQMSNGPMEGEDLEFCEPYAGCTDTSHKRGPDHCQDEVDWGWG